MRFKQKHDLNNGRGTQLRSIATLSRLPYVLVALLGLILPFATVYATHTGPPHLPVGWNTQLCSVLYSGGTSWPGCPGTAMAGFVGFKMLDVFLRDVVMIALRNIFIGVGVIYFAWYAVSMILSRGNETDLTEARGAFGHAAVGMSIIGVTTFITSTFTPFSGYVILTGPGTSLVLFGQFGAAASNIVNFILKVTGVFLMFHVTFAGFRIIVLYGNETEIEKQRKSFFNGLIGIAVLLLANAAANALVPTATYNPAGGGPASFIVEIAGLIRFLLEIVAGLTVIALIGSGILYILSFNNEGLRERAKRAAFSSVIALIVVLSSYSIVSTFI